jgi:hypothetical protein
MEVDAADSTKDVLDGLNVDVTRIMPVPEKAHAVAHIKGHDSYLKMYRESIEDTAAFWDKVCYPIILREMWKLDEAAC